MKPGTPVYVVRERPPRDADPCGNWQVEGPIARATFVGLEPIQPAGNIGAITYEMGPPSPSKAEYGAVVRYGDGTEGWHHPDLVSPTREGAVDVLQGRKRVPFELSDLRAVSVFYMQLRYQAAARERPETLTYRERLLGFEIKGVQK